jgi:transcriptional regulator with XRE-family HTH domain
MVIGDRLRALREQRNMSQGDIEKRTGLLRVYISRVENGHTVPSIETLEKMAQALEVLCTCSPMMARSRRSHSFPPPER